MNFEKFDKFEWFWPSPELGYYDAFVNYLTTSTSHSAAMNGTIDGSIAVSRKIPLFWAIPFGTLCIATLIFYILTSWTRKARMMNKFPGPKVLPFVGNFNHLMCPPEDWQKALSALFAKHGRVFRMWFSFKPIFVVGDGKTAEKILSGYDNLEKSGHYSAFHRVMGAGLATSPVEKWKHDRKLLNPGFGYQYFEGFFKIFNEQSSIMTDVFRETFITGEESMDLLPFIARATMDSVFQTVLGTTRGLQRDPQALYAERVYGLVHCTREKVLKPWLHFPVIWHLFGSGKLEDELIDGLMDDLDKHIGMKCEEKLATGNVTGTHTRPFIAFLMDGISDRKDLAYHVNTLCATGSETTSSALNYLLFLLALNPECQQRVREEIDAMFENSDDGNLTLSDLSELKYGEMCIKEGLRLYPPVAGWFRKLAQDVVLDDGRVMPKGAEAVILPYDVHRNPEVFTNPEIFNPERFTPENRAEIGAPCNWLPFSLGARNCIGNRYGMIQMKTMLTHVLRNFEVSTESNREDLKVIYGVVLEPTPSLKMTLKPRKHE